MIAKNEPLNIETIREKICNGDATHGVTLSSLRVTQMVPMEAYKRPKGDYGSDSTLRALDHGQW